VFENGPEFEDRAREIARAIHAPLGDQGATMFRGREHDGLYITDDAIHAYEFTLLRTKDKAQKDGQKLADILTTLRREKEHKYRSCTGWFVTKEEPTADQRAAIAAIAKSSGITLHAIGFMSLQGRVCDTGEYLRCRDNAPFGSTEYTKDLNVSSKDVAPEFRADSELRSVASIAEEVTAGGRAVVVGEFGVGKSYALRELYRELRKRHYRSQGLNPFPLHVNLRDCVGLKRPGEVLRRHAEDIGFSSERGLISAWRAGSCVLLLDGFDEIVPTRWMGSAASDLRRVRYESLSLIRQLVQEAPHMAGVVVCGRPHFFSSRGEMLEALGFSPTTVTMLQLEDFTDEQLRKFLDGTGVTSRLPDWLPARPLLIGYLLAMQSLGEVGAVDAEDQASAWRKLFNAICQREASILTSVRPEMIKQIMSRVATLARAKGDLLGPIEMNQPERAFVEINGVQPDEEGIQLLLRLPGLANAEGKDSWEGRVFVDTELAETAYGEDLAAYLANPYASHPLAQPVPWTASATQLGVDVAARALEDESLNAGTALAAAKRRQNDGQYDAVLADAIRVADTLSSEPGRHNYLIEGVVFDFLSPGDGQLALAGSTLESCLIETLDFGSLEYPDDCPEFSSCLIGHVEGVTAIPVDFAQKFTNCEFDRFSDNLQTTAGLMQLKLPDRFRVALTILKKLYDQRGTGRVESALSRGLPTQLRPLVPEVINNLTQQGWMSTTSSHGKTIYLPVKDRKADARKALDKPGDFRF
jgi:hypothetical protein